MWVFLNEWLSVIGISSLIAAVVTGFLGLIQTLIVEKRRFKRESKAGYIQSQIRIYTQIWYLLQRIQIVAIHEIFFKSYVDDIKELNEIIKNSSGLIETKILIDWLQLNKSFIKSVQSELSIDEVWDTLWKELDDLISNIVNKINDDLIPKYKEIVGESVPKLVKVEVVRTREIE